MEFTRYSTAAGFLAATQPFLLEKEVENALITSLAQSIASGVYPSSSDHYFASIQDGEALVLGALMTPPFNLILASHTINEDVLKLLIQNVLQLGKAIPGVLGRKDLVQTFCTLWSERTGARSSLKIAERIFELTKIIHPSKVEGSLRQATLNDVDIVGEWIRAFAIDAGIANEFPNPKATAEERISRGTIYLWETKEKGLVSMAAASRPTERGITINLVYTPSAFRSKGYASNCVAALSQLQLDNGFKYCTLFTDLANPTSNSIYQKIGYQPVVDFDLYTFTYPAGNKF